MEQLTPAQKAAQTRSERAERDRTKMAALRTDRERALEVCRQIRDSETAADADRLKAIELLRSLTA